MAPVHAAAAVNDVEILRALLDADPGLIEADESPQGYPSRRPLHCACEAGSVEAADVLLDRGADISALDNWRCTPLLRACMFGRLEVVRLLLARGVDPSVRGGYQKTCLMRAAKGSEDHSAIFGDDKSDHVAVIRLLIDDGRVPVNARDDRGRTALWWACYEGFTEGARLLLVEGGADLTIADSRGTTPTAAASSSYHHSRNCAKMLEWFKGEVQKPYLLCRARAVVDDTESINKAPEKAGAKREAEAQQAREEAAPVYLITRVRKDEPLPEVSVVEVVEVVNQVRRRKHEEETEEKKREEEGESQPQEEGEEGEEVAAMLEYVLRWMKEDLFVELMEGLRYPGEKHAVKAMRIKWNSSRAGELRRSRRMEERKAEG